MRHNKSAAALNASGMETEISCGLKLNYRLDEISPCKPLLAALRSNGVKPVTASDAHRPQDAGRFIAQAYAISG
jgi:histidinol-phosphatase (PHP family)